MLPDHYPFQKCEQKWLKLWQQNHSYNHQKPNSKHPPFAIMIPPPNVTGELHVGHALNQTIQDFLIRYARKCGFSSLWQGGIDHAGIATQTRVEKELAKKKLHRQDLGRERFLQEVWNWKKRSGSSISQQQQRMGFSFAQERVRFTMDKEYSQAVTHAFVQLYNEKLIYRAKKMVSWDPVSQTVLSDLEIEHEENYLSKLTSFAYPLANSKARIVVATTRPETMLADTAIAVHPDDERYKHLIGSTVVHPFIDRNIPIIGDAELVDPTFGTGAVKVTPAHDVNDFACGQRHDLQTITVLDKNACINENGGERFRGMDRYKAREAVIAALKEKNLLVANHDHRLSLARSQRTGAVVEPVLSMQWFLRMQGKMAQAALQALQKKQLHIHPRQWETTYCNWLENIHDWCISRQLWWGHRIPIWYGVDDKIFCYPNQELAQKAAYKYYGKTVKLKQEDDVLDTWFSSALWPFASLGWPKKTFDLKNYYPGSILVTAHDILFFWVARMVMMGKHFMREVPFTHVYIHGLLRDEHGAKMSKTKGNVIDPIVTIDRYGSDAFRFFLLATLHEGKDSLYSEDRLKGYYHLTNKVWNCARFLQRYAKQWEYQYHSDKALQKIKSEKKDKKTWQIEDDWILQRLNDCIDDVHKSISTLKFHLTAQRIYEFVWNDYCDWYVETIKSRLFMQKEESDNIKKIATPRYQTAITSLEIASYVFDCILDLLHPIMPFITEELAEHFNSHKRLSSKKFVIQRAWPTTIQRSLTKKNIVQMNLLQEMITTVRSLRKQNSTVVDANQLLSIEIIFKNTTAQKNLKTLIQNKHSVLQRLARVHDIKLQSASSHENEHAAMRAFSQGTMTLIHETQVDYELLRKQKQKITTHIHYLQQKLENKDFLTRAPESIVAKERKKHNDYCMKLRVLSEQLKKEVL